MKYAGMALAILCLGSFPGYAATDSSPESLRNSAADFGAQDIGEMLGAAAQKGPSVKSASYTGDIWATTDSQEVTLAPGQKESASVSLQSTLYRQVCENPTPWTGPICHYEVMDREVRSFKIVLAEPFPAAWGAQTFRLRLNAMFKPALTVEARDRAHAWQYKLPESYEDVLVVKPVLPASQAFLE